MTMPNPPTPTHAIISQTTFAVLDGDSGDEVILPGIFTANHWQNSGLVVSIQPFDALPSVIAQITVLLDHQDLAHVNALMHAQDRAQFAPIPPSDHDDAAPTLGWLGEIVQRLAALEAAAAPAIANRAWMDAWMDEIEKRLDALVAEAAQKFSQAERRLEALEARPAFSMHQQQRMDDIEAKLRDTAHRLAKIEERFFQAERRVTAGLPGADQMHEQYDAEHDAATISYWDMKLLAMIETTNSRLAAAIGGA